MNETHTKDKGQIAVYLRVSTLDQNLARQDHLREGADRVFEEKASAGTMDRPALTEMLAWVREGDRVRVHSMDRIARNDMDLKTIMATLKAKGVGIEFVKENLSIQPGHASSATDAFFLHVLSGLAELERTRMKERQAEGIAKAKERGVYKGRQTVITQEVIDKVHELTALGVAKAEIARQLSLGRSTVYKALTGEVTKAGAAK